MGAFAYFQNESHDHGRRLMTSSLVLLIMKIKTHEIILNKLKMTRLHENKFSLGTAEKDLLMGLTCCSSGY